MASATYINDPENPMALLPITEGCTQVVDHENNRIDETCDGGTHSFLQKISDIPDFNNVIFYGEDPEFGEFDTNYEFCSYQEHFVPPFAYDFQSEHLAPGQIGYKGAFSIRVTEPLETGVYTYGGGPGRFTIYDQDKSILCCANDRSGTMIVNRDPLTNLITLDIDMTVYYRNEILPFTATIQFTDYLIR